MIAGNDQQCVGVLVAVFLSGFNDFVESDCFSYRTSPVKRMRELVDKTGLEHQEEAFLVFFKYFDCCMKTVGQIGLIGKFFDRVPLELVTIKPTVHVACVEKTEQTIGFLGSLEHGITVGYELIAGLLKEINVVDIVFALGAGSGLWKEIGRAASEHDFGLDVVEHAHDIGFVRSAAGV